MEITPAETAYHNLQIYGPFTFSNTFDSNDNVPDMLESEQPAYSAAFDADPSAKRHAACDECRKRKLKCSGQPSGCGRCMKQSLICHYSIQKQMGRPRKRQRTDDTTQADSIDNHPLYAAPVASIPAIDPSLSSDALDRISFENVCNGPISQAIKRSIQNPGGNPSQASISTSSTSPHDVPKTPPDDFLNVIYPTDVSLWPDFSDMTTLPVPVQERHEKAAMAASRYPATDPDANPSYLSNLPSVPDCPCLPNLYLTLSTLSTLSAFPVSSHTVDTLEAAHRTARSVVYCAVCPQRFQSGSQNVMLSGTLLTVLVDQWQRVTKSSADDLRKGFSTSDDNEPPPSLRNDLEWRTFAHDLVRAHVFGDRSAPRPPCSKMAFQGLPTSQLANRPDSNAMLTAAPTGVKSSPALTLMGLAEAMERRQRQWHGMDVKTDEFPSRLTEDLMNGHTAGMTLEDIKSYESEVKDYLCLQIVRHAKMCIRSLDKAPPVL